jgi:Ala-tRNA(Pro) deacylase
MKEEFEKLIEFLKEHPINYQTYSHESIHTAEDASKVRNVPMEQGLKSIIVKSEKGFYVLLVSGNRKIVFEKLKSVIGAARLADPKDVFRITHCEIGSVHPFGNLFGLKVIMDRHVLDSGEVHFSAGTHNDSITMDPKDIEKLTKAEVLEFSELK